MPELGVSFVDERNSLSYWYPRIEHLDVPVLSATRFDISQARQKLDKSEKTLNEELSTPQQLVERLKTIPTADIKDAISELPSERAHIRGGYKSSGTNDGITARADPKEIDGQILELVDDSVMSGFPLETLVIREHLDAYTYGMSYGNHLHPEVRFIVDNGEVLTSFVDLYPSDFDRKYSADTDSTEDAIDEELVELELLAEDTQETSDNENESTLSQEEILTDVERRFEADYDELSDYAKQVATELDGGWSVDFIQDTNGEWHLIDMALYGLWWSEKHNEWKNISHVPDGNPYNLEENPPETLPESPTDDMVRTDR